MKKKTWKPVKAHTKAKSKKSNPLKSDDHVKKTKSKKSAPSKPNDRKSKPKKKYVPSAKEKIEMDIVTNNILEQIRKNIFKRAYHKTWWYEIFFVVRASQSKSTRVQTTPLKTC